MSRSSGGSTTIYVTGFGHGTRARDLAYEFERFGRLVRCDIPAPRTASARLFAFVEYKHLRDAEDAYHDMHNVRISRDETLKCEWARTPPSANWRLEAGSGRSDRRDRSPRRSGRSASPPRRSRADSRTRDRDRDRRDDRSERRERHRSRSPDVRDRDGKERDRDRDSDLPRRDRYRSRTPEVGERVRDRDRDRDTKDRPRDVDREDGTNGNGHKERGNAAAPDDLDTVE